MKLYEFPGSHFCDKARWALSYKNIEYQRAFVLPAVHYFVLAPKVDLSRPRLQVPVLSDGRVNIHGSSNVLDYLEEKYPNPSLNPKQTNQQWRELELELTKIGEDCRRIYFYYAMSHPTTFRKIFCYDHETLRKLGFFCLYPGLFSYLKFAYRVHGGQTKRSIDRVKAIMDRLAGILEKQPYLAGDRFTRLDITAATMLSTFTLPKSNPWAWKDIEKFEALHKLGKELDNHPTTRWIRRLYDMRIEQLPPQPNHRLSAQEWTTAS